MTKVFGNEKDLELLKRFKNGDEYSFTELLDKYESLFYEFKKLYKYSYVIDKLHFNSSYHLAFYHAVDSFDETKDVKFITHLYTCIKNRMIKDIDYWQRKDRNKLQFGTIPLDGVVRGKENDMDVKNTFGVKDYYFADEFIETKDAIIYALEKANPLMKPYLVQLATLEIDQGEVVKLTGLSKQVVSYQFKRFKESMKNFLEQNKYEKAI